MKIHQKYKEFESFQRKEIESIEGCILDWEIKYYEDTVTGSEYSDAFKLVNSSNVREGKANFTAVDYESRIRKNGETIIKAIDKCFQKLLKNK